jgi:hypothetical protein
MSKADECPKNPHREFAKIKKGRQNEKDRPSGEPKFTSQTVKPC